VHGRAATVRGDADATNGPKVLSRAGAAEQLRQEPIRYPAPVIEFEDFMRVDMRVGRVLSAEAFPEARKPSYRLRIDFGPDIGERVSSAQLTATYPDPAVLVGRQIVAVVNFPPRRIAGFSSEVLVLGAMGDAGEVHLLTPDPEAPEGLRVG
jgi:tRNA-binding protein